MAMRQRRHESRRGYRDYRDNDGDHSRDSIWNKESGSEPRQKPPLLQFTTDINPECFSGPIPFPLATPARTANNIFRNDDFKESEYASERKYRRESRGSDYHSDDDRRSRRFRDSRERDRERDRVRDRERGRDRDRSYDRDMDRSERERDRGRDREWREEIPNNTIMVRSLDSFVTEDDLRYEVTRYGLDPKDIRLIREKETGASRGFAFVEFQLLSEAVRWKELTKSVIYFNGSHRATLHYSIPKEAPGADRSLLNKADWDCAKCGMSNFRRRDVCFKCNASREETFLLGRQNEGCNEISSSPSNTLLFRNLDILTTEERVLAMLGQLTTLPIKSLRVAKDPLTNTSRGFAFVELHSTSEATQLHDLLLSMAGNFYVDGRQVTVSYAKRSLTSMNSAASANAAVVALAAAQWTNQEASNSPMSYAYSPASDREHKDASGEYTDSSRQVELSSLGTIVVNSVTYKRYPLPDISTYQYDESSGYYYDASTGLYYDANSQYYYNPETKQYLFWSGDHQTYLPAPTSNASSYPTNGSDMSSTSNSQMSSQSQSSETQDAENQEKSKNKKEEKQDKVKIAKKIAKDMERWAKTLNQKKENAKLGIVATPLVDVNTSSSIIEDAFKHSAAADAGFAVLEKRTSLSERNTLMSEVLKHKEIMDSKLSFSVSAKGKPTLVASYGDSDSESEADAASHLENKIKKQTSKADESKLTDWTKLACLLCKRQFATKEALCRHQQLSDLHKKNLAKITGGDQT